MCGSCTNGGISWTNSAMPTVQSSHVIICDTCISASFYITCTAGCQHRVFLLNDRSSVLWSLASVPEPHLCLWIVQSLLQYSRYHWCSRTSRSYSGGWNWQEADRTLAPSNHRGCANGFGFLTFAWWAALLLLRYKAVGSNVTVQINPEVYANPSIEVKCVVGSALL